MYLRCICMCVCVCVWWAKAGSAHFGFRNVASQKMEKHKSNNNNNNHQVSTLTVQTTTQTNCNGLAVQALAGRRAFVQTGQLSTCTSTCNGVFACVCLPLDITEWEWLRRRLCGCQLTIDVEHNGALLGFTGFLGHIQAVQQTKIITNHSCSPLFERCLQIYMHTVICGCFLCYAQLRLHVACGHSKFATSPLR